MEYRWFTILLLVIFILFIIFAIFVRKKRIIAWILIFLAAIILTRKTIEFAYYGLTNTGTYPIEISHISYFVFGVIILSGVTKLYFTAGIFALLSGLGYIVAGVASPQTVINSLPTHLFIMGIISHMILLLGGILVLFDFTKYSKKYFYFPLIGLCLVLLLAYLVDNKYLYPNATGLDNLVVIKLINGSILTYLGVDSNNLILNYLATGAIFVAVIIIIYLINVINNKIFKMETITTKNFSIYKELSSRAIYKIN